MADFTPPSWLFPQEGAWTSFIKGSQAGAAIAANRLRAKQIYVDVQQHQQKMDLAERQFVASNEQDTLKNEVIRTKLANDAADFQTLREWWPKFQESIDGEIDPPVLRDENAMLRVSAAVAQKREKIGQAAFASLMAEPGFDLALPENQKRYFELMSKYKNIMGKLGPDGIMQPIKAAETLKRLRDEAESRITARQDRSTLNRLMEERRALVANSTIDVNDARIAKYDRDITLEERRLAVQEGNLDARNREQTGKETRLGLRERYLNERNAIDREEKSKLATMSPTSEEAERLRKLYNLKRREVTKKFYGPEMRPGLKTEDRTTNAPPAVVAPSGTNPPQSAVAPTGKVRVISPDGTPGFIPENQLEEALKAGYTKP